MENLNEQLLSVWLELSSALNNSRLVTQMPYNEAHVCNLLYRRRAEAPEKYLTATDLCAQTRMLKSQMNKVLNSLEKSGMIERFRAQHDRRMVYIRLVEENVAVFEAEHARSLAIVERIVAQLSPEEAVSALETLGRLARISLSL